MFERLISRLRTNQNMISEASSLAKKSLITGLAGGLYASTGFILAGILVDVYPQEVAMNPKVRETTASGIAIGASIPPLIKLGLMATKRIPHDYRLAGALAATSAVAVIVTPRKTR